MHPTHHLNLYAPIWSFSRLSFQFRFKKYFTFLRHLFIYFFLLTRYFATHIGFSRSLAHRDYDRHFSYLFFLFLRQFLSFSRPYDDRTSISSISFTKNNFLFKYGYQSKTKEKVWFGTIPFLILSHKQLSWNEIAPFLL